MGADDQIKFDEKQHIYRINGVVYPGVTTIIRDLGLMDTSHFTPETAHRGKVVAVATTLIDRGFTVDELRIGDECRGYVQSYALFRAAERATVNQSEAAIFCQSHRFCGTLDRVMARAGMPSAVRELKTGSPAPWHPLQTAGYWLALVDTVPASRLSREALYLQADGSLARLVEHRNFRDIDTFMAAATLWHWRNANGSGTKPTDPEGERARVEVPQFAGAPGVGI